MGISESTEIGLGVEGGIKNQKQNRNGIENKNLRK